MNTSAQSKQQGHDGIIKTLLKEKLIIVTTMLILVFSTLSIYTLIINQQSLKRLLQMDLPLFIEVQDLVYSTVTTRNIVYEYYITTDTDVFQNKLSAEQKKIRHIISSLKTHLTDNTKLQEIETSLTHLFNLAYAFDQVMQRADIDWDKAREILAVFSPDTDKIVTQNAELTKAILANVMVSSDLSMKRIQTMFMIMVTLILILIGLLVILFKLYLDNKNYLRQSKLQASFPERNLNPVLALDPGGKMLYANQAALSWSRRLFQQDDVNVLLPDKFEKCLHELESIYHWEYKKNKYFLDISVHWLADFQEYHIYIEDITARKVAEKKIYHMAYYDRVTNLPNKETFEKIITDSRNVSVMALLDLDDFDRVRTLEGLRIAEKVILECGKRLTSVIRSAPSHLSTRLYRLNDSFFGVTFNRWDEQTACVLKNLMNCVKSPITVDEHEFFLFFSIGIIKLDSHVKLLPEEIIRKADIALRSVKMKGGNGMAFYDAALERENKRWVEIETGLRKARLNKDIVLFYQPKLSVETGEIDGAEALLRWISDGQLVSTADFIPVAEKSGIILDISGWILAEACQQASLWRSKTGKKKSVAVNISAKQLVHGELIKLITQALAAADLPPDCLEIEITETAALEDFEQAVSVMQRINELGVKIAIDDFGTGFSSLSYLKQLPVQTLKIDQSFVRHMLENSGDALITQAIIDLAHNFRLSVVAEGVEHIEQLKILKSWGCDSIQGYLISKPLPVDDFLKVILSHDPRHWSSLMGS